MSEEAKGDEDEELAATVELEPDGIVVLRFREGVHMDGERTRRVMKVQIAVAGGEKRPTLSDIRAMGGSSVEARREVSGPEMLAVVERMALLVGSPATRMTGNFFLRVTRPPYPTRLFSDEAAARRWLLGEEP